jgi:hypothetical protein
MWMETGGREWQKREREGKEEGRRRAHRRDKEGTGGG